MLVMDNITIYPKSKIFAYDELFLCRFESTRLPSLHVLTDALTMFRVRYKIGAGIIMNAPHCRIDDAFGRWGTIIELKDVGFKCVGTIQRFWRAVLARKRKLAFMMLAHSRLGSTSGLNALDVDILKLCCLLAAAK